MVQEMKKRFKDQKGLTLIELLAVVVVLGIIAAIAVPSVSATIEKSKKNADKATWLIIKDAGLRWALEENVSNGESKKVEELVSNGYINDSPVAQSDKIKGGFSYIKVNKKGNKYEVEVYDGGGNLITERTFID